MPVHIDSSWVKPSRILFAAESPTNEKAFAFALATARELKAKLIILHVYDTLSVAASEFSGVRYYDYAGSARTEERMLRPLVERASDLGVACEIVVRPGLAAPQILAYAAEHPIDRIIMGTRAPGRLGKLFVGSVAEEVVRGAHVPVLTVGPEAIEGALKSFNIRRILTAVSLHSHASLIVAEFATLLAAHHGARLTLLHVSPSRDHSSHHGLTLENIETELRGMLPPELQQAIHVEAITYVGDPAAEILYQSKLRQSDLLVFGAQEASPITTLTRLGTVNKVLAQALCPVMTITAHVPAKVVTEDSKAESEAYLAGIF